MFNSFRLALCILIVKIDTALNGASDIASSIILKGGTLSNYNVNGLSLDTTTNSIFKIMLLQK